MKRLIWFLLFAAVVACFEKDGRSQNPVQFQPTTVDPTGQACNSTRGNLKTPDGKLYSCQNGTMAQVGGGGPCATCVTSAASLTDTALVAGSGGAQGTATPSATTTLNAAGMLSVAGGLNIPSTSSSTVGVINQNSASYLYSPLDNTNLFLGAGTGNFTLSTANGGRTGLGSLAMASITSGVFETALGYRALNAETTGSSNTAIGEDAMRFGSGNIGNVAVGRQAMGSGTLASALDDTAIGAQALQNLTTGGNNVALGQGVATAVTSGANNTCLGVDSCLSIVAGSNNVEIGFTAGSTLGVGDVSNKLYIDVNRTDSPLIGGDFSGRTVTVSGTLNATAIDQSGAAPTSGLKLPTAAGAAPTADGFIAVNSTTHALVNGSNGATMVGAVAATGTGTSTTCTNQFVTVISAVAVPTCTTATGAYFGSSIAARTSLGNATASVGAPSFSTTEDQLAYQVAEIPSQVEVCSAGGTGCTTGAFTTSGVGTALETITGLSWTFPANTALNIPFECHITYHQNGAAVNVNFGYNNASVAQTNLTAHGTMQITTAAPVPANLVNSAPAANTSTNFFTAAAPSAITTNWNVDIWGYIEQPSNGSSSLFTIRTSTATAGDTVTVVRGSYCHIGI